ncbi:MAG TPA: XF1762 family protein [Acidimicrobiales bacterium]
MSLRLVPVSFSQAAAFVAMWLHHHRPPVGHKFSLGVADGDRLVGVAMVGRPVARHLDDGLTLEVNRTATDGTPNANSMLYAAAWRAAKALGYGRLITYTQEAELGSSLRAAGWRVVAERPARTGWSAPSRPRDDRGVDHMPRTLWEAA